MRTLFSLPACDSLRRAPRRLSTPPPDAFQLHPGGPFQLRRPTFADGDGVTVETHALRDYGRDFYGEDMEVVVVGYLRPEMKFDGMAALVNRIMTDIGLARNALDDPGHRGRADDAHGFAEER